MAKMYWCLNIRRNYKNKNRDDNMAETEYFAEFKSIVEQYRMSPFGFRLRKTGSVLKLIEYNGLLYIDSMNLYKIVTELFNRNVSQDIIPYIEKIIFSEIITIEKNSAKESKLVTCIQFVDESFFNKCHDWLSTYGSGPDDEHDIIVNTFYTPKNIFSHKTFPFAGEQNKICELSPFDKHSTFQLNQILQNTPSINSIDKTSINTRPRGKQMQMNREALTDRPFICEVPFCDRAFKRHEHLKRHLKMHTGDRPYKCAFPNCMKTFSRSDNLQQHQKTHSASYTGGSSIKFRNDMFNIKKNINKF